MCFLCDLILVTYKVINIVQSILILITGISVFDSGANFPKPYGLLMNYILFDFIKLNNFPLWGLFQFWGYNFIIVAIIQLLKTKKLDERFNLFEF